MSGVADAGGRCGLTDTSGGVTDGSGNKSCIEWTNEWAGMVADGVCVLQEDDALLSGIACFFLAGITADKLTSWECEVLSS